MSALPSPQSAGGPDRRRRLIVVAIAAVAVIVVGAAVALIIHNRGGGGGPVYADVVRQGLAVHRQDENRENSTCGSTVDAACRAALSTALSDLRSFATALNGVTASASMTAEDGKLRRYVPAEADATQALIRAIDAGDQGAIGTHVSDLISAQTQVDNAPDLAGH